jgi:anti-sigma factor RsiW
MNERLSRTDKELWRRLAPDRDVAPEAISDLEFAAWLDGRLPEAAAARIDAAVAADPELRRVAFDLADVLGKPLPAAPARMAVRAQALVGFEAERRSGSGSGFLGWLFSSGTGYALQRAAMAAMAIVIAGAGFIVGGGLGESFAQQRYGSSVTQTASETSNELTDFSDGI